MRRALLVLGLLGAATPAAAQSARLLDVVHVTALMAHGADLYGTGRCIGAGTCREGNPLLRPFVHKPILFGGTVMALAGTSLVLKQHARARHPRLVFWLSVGETVGVGWIAVHNSRLRGRE